MYRCVQHGRYIRFGAASAAAAAASRNYRSITTWSPLATAYNARPNKKLNVSLSKGNVGLFKIAELQDYTGFYLLKDNVEAVVDYLLKQAVNSDSQSDRKWKMVEIADELSDALCKVADMADCMRMGHPDKHYSTAAEDTCLFIGSLVEKLNTNVELYDALKRVAETGDQFPTDGIDQHVLNLFIADFEKSGIHLDETKRKKFVDLNTAIYELGNSYMRSTQQQVILPKSNLPKDLRHVFALDGDNIRVTGLYSDHHNEKIREAAYRIFLHPDQHQEEILLELLERRNELAEITGFRTYSQRATKYMLAQTPEKVMEFLNVLSEKTQKSALNDFEILRKMKGSELMQWDVSYYSGLARHNRCKIDAMSLAPYFSLGSCMDGLNNLFQSLFGIRLQFEPVERGEVWHDSVSKLAVIDDNEGCLGHIYCDLYERPGKLPSDCHFTIRGGRLKRDGSYQNPIVTLSLNLPQPFGDRPSLLTPGMVENLFHEFGHAMHSMLGRTRYQHITGTRCCHDFAEVPSVLMEYFASDPRVLSTFARHYETGEQLNYTVLEDMCMAKNMFTASEKQLQICYSVLDQRLHGKHPLQGTTADIYNDIQRDYYHLKPVTNTAWSHRFSHLIGYGAYYYSYLMSRAIASRIWYKCFQADPFNSTMGRRYRVKILKHGGGIPPETLISDMLDETPSMSNLLQSLVEEIDAYSNNY
ncbi:mitochondrial intermediate peptidase-like [Tubulanus polymorphus]|uniref:mitochondrial intermediate peptidase-like n=1 Tax=Tubulanus polymorphus TaxID=672921 RepID=UPI003DA2D9A3